MEAEKEVKTNEELKQDWIQKELDEIGNAEFEGERLPALKFEEGKITEFEVDTTTEFQKWIDPNDQTVKKIMPVSKDGERFVVWLNVRNPLYRQILEKLKEGQNKMRVLRTGQRENTRYTLVKE